MNSPKVNGILQVKKNKYYVVLSWYENEVRKRRWISTGLTPKGNKKKAEEILSEEINKMEKELFLNPCEMLFGDFMEQWLELRKLNVQYSTYVGYRSKISNIIAPYFNQRKIYLKNLKPIDIIRFYNHELCRNISPNTIEHYHANIHKALQYAVTLELIDKNPANNVELPKKIKYNAKYCSPETVKQILEKASGTNMETPVILAAFYGLRRSEVVGLKWESVDFENNIIAIENKAVQKFSGNRLHSTIEISNKMKTQSSLRMLPLVPTVKEHLLSLKQKIERNKMLFGNSYNNEYCDYVCVKLDGSLISPDYITSTFSRLAKSLGLPDGITFHSLRHSCATMLVLAGVPMKQIQPWLGHSNYSTTADIYSHIEYANKIPLGDKMDKILSLK